MQFISLLFLFSITYSVVSGQFYCADLLQQCAKSAADITEQILQFKEAAFKQCVRRPSCHTEKKIFDECYDSSVSATHSSSLSSPTNDGDTTSKVVEDTLEKFFTEKAVKYRSSLDQCFVKSPFVPKRNFFGPTLLDEDASYARAIYQFDLADRLWGLPELTITRPSLDTLGVCGHKNPALRLFGSGINRMARTSDPKTNNITGSCMLDEDELKCYREALDLNSQYVQLVYNRDYAIRNCVQTIRTQSVCRLRDKSRLRSCLCGVREQYDNDIQSSILQCVKSKGSHAPSMVIEMSSSLDAASSETIQEQVAPARIVFDTPGAVINGQCMCSCNAAANSRKSALSEDETTTPIETLTVLKKDEEPPKSPVLKFKENSPRLMQPREAMGRVFWSKDNLTFI
ncbi:unnamed protein product [Caenorhabditis angaria]|uniref:DUF19 domain-containing protein n=1 Tax=Caenorhabditis angaria TaxID=860376 RepID=A0A9P1N9N9_9PELO|nr:unnamed protein product [Caenorhabditis angaria]